MENYQRLDDSGKSEELGGYKKKILELCRDALTAILIGLSPIRSAEAGILYPSLGNIGNQDSLLMPIGYFSDYDDSKFNVVIKSDGKGVKVYFEFENGKDSRKIIMSDQHVRRFREIKEVVTGINNHISDENLRLMVVYGINITQNNNKISLILPSGCNLEINSTKYETDNLTLEEGEKIIEFKYQEKRVSFKIGDYNIVLISKN